MIVYKPWVATTQACACVALREGSPYLLLQRTRRTTFFKYQCL